MSCRKSEKALKKQSKEKKMNDLAKKTIEKIKSTPGYHFDESIVVEVCEAGINGIAIGSILYNDGTQKLVREEKDIVCYKKDIETKRTPIAGAEDSIVGLWAEVKSRLCHKIGCM